LDQHPHRLESFQVGGQELKLHVPLDPDAIFFAMTEEEFGEEERLPHWARLWPGALGLAEFVTSIDWQPGLRVLDLGCGLALNGILAARAGTKVVAADWFVDALDFASANAKLNDVEMQVMHLDWNHPPPGLEFDCVLGADLLYEVRNHQPVLNFLNTVLTRHGRAILSDHGRPHLPQFRELLAKKQWKYQESMQGSIHIFDLARS